MVLQKEQRQFWACLGSIAQERSLRTSERGQEGTTSAVRGSRRRLGEVSKGGKGRDLRGNAKEGEDKLFRIQSARQGEITRTAADDRFPVRIRQLPQETRRSISRRSSHFALNKAEGLP